MIRQWSTCFGSSPRSPLQQSFSHLPVWATGGSSRAPAGPCPHLNRPALLKFRLSWQGWETSSDLSIWEYKGPGPTLSWTQLKRNISDPVSQEFRRSPTTTSNYMELHVSHATTCFPCNYMEVCLLSLPNPVLVFLPRVLLIDILNANLCIRVCIPKNCPKTNKACLAYVSVS